MKLLNEIIDLLSVKDGSLTDALLKTKVLMHKIGHKELAEWVNDELNGYPGDKEVPEYRVVPARLLANVANSAWRRQNQQMPLSHLPEDLQKKISENKLRQSIRVLEQYATKPQGSLQLPVSPEFQHTFGATVLQNGWIESMWTQIEVIQIIHILVEVRSRLLDFVLALQDKFGDVKEDDVKEIAKGIDAPAMFHNLVTGDNTTIVVGNHNTTSIQNTVKRGDFASLASALKNKGVSDGDINELQLAIKKDEGTVDVEKKQFGSAVRAWMSKMMGKAVEASWQIELGVAGGLLTEALKAYYF